MKLKLAIVAACSLLTSTAHAQGKPTIEFYGVADVNVSAQNTGAGLNYTVGSGGFDGSRLGIKGEAPLAEGVAGVYLLETGINFNTGDSGNANQPAGLNNAGASSGGHLGNGPQFWSRQIFAGVRTTYGTVTVGRQYTPNYIIAAGIVLPYPGMISVTGGLTTQTQLPTRVNNSVYYTSPTISGLRLMAGGFLGDQNNTEGNVASGTNFTNSRAGRGADAALFYNQGGLSLNVGAWRLNRSTYAATETALAVRQGYQVGVTYKVLDLCTLYGEFTQGTVSGGNYANVTKTLSKSTAWAASIKFPIGKFNLAANYATLNDQSLLNKDAEQLGLQAWYDIQPKAHFYAAWAYMLNHRNSTYNIVDAANLVAQSLRPGADGRAFQVGYSHGF